MAVSNYVDASWALLMAALWNLDSYLKDLSPMRAPVVAMPPDAIPMPIEHPNLAVDGAGGASVTVAVEGDGLHEVLVPVFDEEVEARFLLGCGRVV